MTQISDNLYVGDAPTSTNVNNAARGYGPVGRIVVYDVVPMAACSTNLISALTTAQIGALTISAGYGVTSQVSAATGSTVYILDTPRTLQAKSTNTTDVEAITISAIDVYSQPFTENITLTPGTVAVSKKAASAVYSLTLLTTQMVGALSVGTSDVFGIPFILPDVNDIVSVKWASALAQDTGTAVAADATDPALVSTGDVRGTYKPSSASNGSRRLTISQYLPDSTMAAGASRSAVLGVTQA